MAIEGSDRPFMVTTYRTLDSLRTLLPVILRGTMKVKLLDQVSQASTGHHLSLLIIFRVTLYTTQ